jgi:hypothetical protein
MSSVVASIQCASSSTIRTGSPSPIRTSMSTISANVDALRCAGVSEDGSAQGIDNSSANNGTAEASEVLRSASHLRSFSTLASGASVGAKPAARLRYWITG